MPLRSATTIVCVRLTDDELLRLDAVADNRSDALRLLIGSAQGSGLLARDNSLPVLWWRLISDLERFHRSVAMHGRPAPGVLRVIDAVHREDYPAALGHLRDLEAEWEPS